MKNILKIIAVTLMVFSLNSCEDETIVYGNTNFAQLADANAVTVTENSGAQIELSVILGAPRAEAVTVNYDITGTADPSRYSFSSPNFVIPAGETSASLTFEPIDNDDIDGDVDVILTLSSTSGIPVGFGGEGVNGSAKTITIIDDNVPCNNYVLVVTTDAFPEETTWEVTDADGMVLFSGGEDYGPPSSAASRGVEYTHLFTLEDGCYTFTIFDTFGDGLSDGAFTGGYTLDCGALNAASGTGAFSNGTFESTDFCVNQ